MNGQLLLDSWAAVGAALSAHLPCAADARPLPCYDAGRRPSADPQMLTLTLAPHLQNHESETAQKVMD